MALTKEEREARKKINELLDRYSNGMKEVYEKDFFIPISEDALPKGKISTLKDLQQLMDDYKDRLEFLGKNRFSSEAEGDVRVSILLFSTKTVKVPDDDNLLTIGYRVGYDYYDNELELSVISNIDDKSTKLKDFMELPIKPDVKDEVSADDLVRRCDSAIFYKIYLEEAISLISKPFSKAYFMFTGSKLYKKEEKVIFVDGQPRENTLYVTYDKIKKMFKFSYNPDFILRSVIVEWMLNRSAYKSLKDCYCYWLAFMITHEMLHIVTHNSNSTGVDDSRLSTSDHEVANCVQDSFINCWISKRFASLPGLNRVGYDRLAPMLEDGVGSKVSVRIEHNQGLKKFNNLKELEEAITKEVLKGVGGTSSSRVSNSYSSYMESRDLSKYEGADLFISVNISPTLKELRKDSSNLFQECFNNIIKSITDGKAHEIHAEFSIKEKASDLDILPVGTIVMVRGKRDVGIIVAYDEELDKYSVNEMVSKGVKLLKSDEIGDLYVTDYVDSGKSLGVFNRVDIMPYNPEDDAYYANAKEEPKQDKLTPEDLQQLAGGGAPMPPSGGQQDENKAKSLKVGDIVWVRKAKKFGRIVSISDGKFNIEEVVELPCKVLDDSDNYI